MPGMFEKLVDRAFDLLQSRIGLRHLLELLGLVLGSALTFYLVSRTTSEAEVLAATIWASVRLWHALLSYRIAFQPSIRMLALALALLTSAAWIFGLVRHLTSTHRELAKVVQLADEFAAKGMYSDAANRYQEGLAAAQRSGDKKS